MIELTAEQIEDLVKLTSWELSRKYGWSYNQISSRRRQHEIRKFERMRKEKVATPPLEEIEGKTLQEVMKKHRVSRQVAIRFFRNYAIPWKRYPGAMAVGSMWLAELEEVKMDMRHLRVVAVLPFLTDAEAARAFELSREWIGELRKKYRVPMAFKRTEGTNEENKKEEEENGREGRVEQTTG